MSRLLAKLPKEEKSVYRAMLASWGEQTIHDYAEHVCVQGGARLGEFYKEACARNMTVDLLAKITNECLGDPNPVFVPGSNAEVLAEVMDSLRQYTYEVAMCLHALAEAQTILDGADFESDEANALNIVTWLEKKIARLAYELGQKWSWKALKVFQEGEDSDDEEEGESASEEEVEGEGEESEGEGEDEEGEASGSSDDDDGKPEAAKAAKSESTEAPAKRQRTED